MTVGPVVAEPPGGPAKGRGAGKALDDFSLVGDLLPRVEGSAGEAGEPSTRAPRPGDASRATAPRGAEDPARRLAAIWPDVVGEEVAANARPVHLRRGRLVVSTSSSVWAQTLQLMSEAVLARLTERLGAGVVEQVVFRHAGWEERPPVAPGPAPAGPPASAGPAPAAPAPAGSQGGPVGPDGGPEENAGGDARRSTRPGLSRDQMEALAAVERLDLPADLREKIIRSMRAAFVRGEQDSVR